MTTIKPIIFAGAVIGLAWFGISSTPKCEKYKYVQIGDITLGATIGVCDDND